MNKKQVLKFLNNHKSLVGFSDWNIIVLSDLVSEDKSAESSTDILEKTITIRLCKDFKNFSDKEQKKVLMHELIHSRVLVMKQNVDEHLIIEEEHFVNDLVRGLKNWNL